MLPEVSSVSCRLVLADSFVLDALLDTVQPVGKDVSDQVVLFKHLSIESPCACEMPIRRLL